MVEATDSVGGRLKLPGIALIAMGVICVLAPVMAGGLVIMVIGLLMLVAGLALLFQGSKFAGGFERGAALVLGGILTVAGMLVVVHPLLGLAFLTLLLVFFFVSDGLWKMITAFRYRPATGWQWMLISGILSLLLGLIIWNQWPVSGAWAVGILVGINLMSTGIALLALASAFKTPN